MAQSTVSKPQLSLTVSDFFAQAESLRDVYDKNFENPHKLHEKRFVWDYWHVPDQYTYFRTHADRYFPASLYGKFQRALRDWGEVNLGCSSLTPLWLSFYVDGCCQGLHADVPHGPWAVVFSLTHWSERKFVGGETLLLRPDSDRYWSEIENSQRVESPELWDKISPVFNRLTVFDPRIPHSVNRVEGVRDPRDARIVLHGWFLEPTVCCGGGFVLAKCIEQIKNVIRNYAESQIDYGKITGLLLIRIEVHKNGILSIRTLTNTLVAGESAAKPEHAVVDMAKRFSALVLPSATDGAWINIPMRFQTAIPPRLLGVPR